MAKLPQTALHSAIFGAMGLCRITMVVLGSVLAGLCCGQSVMHKHLVISMGGGGGYTSMHNTSDELKASGLPSSAVRFAFAYAMSDRLSLGGHYDRIGSVVHPNGVERVRFTTYLIEGTYRPFIGKHSAVELSLGIGGAITVLRPTGHLIPFETRAPAFALGARYLHLINESIGGFVALDHAQAFPRELTFHGETIHTSTGSLLVAWHSQRITAGMFVRF